MAYVFDSVPAQRNRIDLGNPLEVHYWARKFGCNETQLRVAVAHVGTSAASVEQLLDGVELLNV